MVTNEVFNRVFQIKIGSGTASGFLISLEEVDYLITARHTLPKDITTGSNLDFEIMRNQKWEKLNATVLLHDNEKVDVAVLNLHSNNAGENLFDIEITGSSITQDCYFLGYPFGSRMDHYNGNNGYPAPFVKKGIISAVLKDGDAVLVCLDGHNNPGFSGGPVVINNPSGLKHRMKIIGIVSGYRMDDKVKGTPVGNIITYENSGIVYCYSIEHAKEIINKNK
ncbi:S1 family peptidase [Marinifilum breve]|nr:serine protease [Marinifilum breve]